MIDSALLEDFPRSARDAIHVAQDRVRRAVDASDVEGIVGSSKELIECVAKAVIDFRGGSYGSDIAVPQLANRALDVLKLHPIALQGRGSLQRLSQSLISAAQAIAELRNTDGTGHGRSARTNLDLSHALLCQEVAVTWCKWIVTTARRTDIAPVDEVVSKISGETLSRGKLSALLDALGLVELGDDDQRKVGLAVARRWTVNDTFLPLMDIIEPLAAGHVEYPPAFCEGVLEGLLLDDNGYLVVKRPKDIQLVVDIGRRLPGHSRETAFKNLADRIEEARPSYKFDAAAQDQAAGLWRGIAAQEENIPIKASIDRIASRIEDLHSAR